MGYLDPLREDVESHLAQCLQVPGGQRGMWLGTIIFVNVWFVIWPNQKKALGMVEVDADSKAKAARTAMLFSRTNTMLSIPMPYAMVSAQNLY